MPQIVRYSLSKRFAEAGMRACFFECDGWIPVFKLLRDNLQIRCNDYC